MAPSLQALQSEVSLLREHLVEGRREWEGKVAQLERDAQQAALAHQVPPTNAHAIEKVTVDTLDLPRL